MLYITTSITYTLGFRRVSTIYQLSFVVDHFLTVFGMFKLEIILKIS